MKRSSAAYAHPEEKCGHCESLASGSTIGIHGLIVEACDEILAGRHHDMFPHVWMMERYRVQHERERGDLELVLLSSPDTARAARCRVRSERSRQHVEVLDDTRPSAT